MKNEIPLNMLRTMHLSHIIGMQGKIDSGDGNSLMT